MVEYVQGRTPVVCMLRDAVGGRASLSRFSMVQAPGRVNLIGEHIDYNGGHVLPIPIGRVVGIAARKRAHREHRITSLNFRESCTFAVGTVPTAPAGSWVRYVAGMLCEMARHAAFAPALALDVYGDIPLGAGLSSSAALCIATGLAFEAVTGTDIDPIEMARMAQRVEQVYAGVQCGIMDQMASRLGRPHHALLLSCDTLAYEQVPIPAHGARLMLIDSGVRRALAASRYNERRQECSAALTLGRRHGASLRSLCAMDRKMAERLKPAVLRNRAVHAVDEDARVHAAAAALTQRDWAALGRLFTASHVSLRDLYEVSCAELDFLVETALAVPGVLGARMTGGGFGGCTINVVREDTCEDLREAATQAYQQAFKREPRIYELRDSLQAGMVRPA